VNHSRVLIGRTLARRRGPQHFLTGITAVDRLPEAKYGGPTLRAVDKQGAAVVEIDGQTFYIYPRHDWERTVQTDYDGCPATQTDTLTNFGLLRDDDMTSLNA